MNIKLSNIKFPDNLSNNGFDNLIIKKENVDKTKLEPIINFIELWFDKTSSYNKSVTSYNLKHIVERQIESSVSNGELIAAMIACNYTYKKAGINAYFNVSLDALPKQKFK